jgi:hypothetical protein
MGSSSRAYVNAEGRFGWKILSLLLGCHRARAEARVLIRRNALPLILTT